MVDDDGFLDPIASLYDECRIDRWTNILRLNVPELELDPIGVQPFIKASDGGVLSGKPPLEPPPRSSISLADCC